MQHGDPPSFWLVLIREFFGEAKITADAFKDQNGLPSHQKEEPEYPWSLAGTPICLAAEAVQLGTRPNPICLRCA
jgi:hypothetical protein